MKKRAKRSRIKGAAVNGKPVRRSGVRSRRGGAVRRRRSPVTTGPGSRRRGRGTYDSGYNYGYDQGFNQGFAKGYEDALEASYLAG